MDFLETARAGGIRRIAKCNVTAARKEWVGVVYRALEKALGREVAITSIVAVYDNGVDNQIPTS